MSWRLTYILAVTAALTGTGKDREGGGLGADAHRVISMGYRSDRLTHILALEIFPYRLTLEVNLRGSP